MIGRLFLTTAIGIALGTAAFAQGADPSKTDSSAPAAAQTASQAPAGGVVTLSAGVSVTEPERARIGESLARVNVKSLRGVDFSVSVGTKVPRELRTYPLPADVTGIVPQYRNFRFLVVNSDILIVEPPAQKIVTILKRDSAPTVAAAKAIPAPSPAAPAATPPAATIQTPTIVAPTTPAPATPAPAASTSPPSTSTSAAAEPPSAPNGDRAAEPDRAKPKKQAAKRTPRRAVSRAARDDWRRASADVQVGQRVPDDVVLHRLPPRYYREVPGTSEYRYRGYGWRGRTVYQEFD